MQILVTRPRQQAQAWVDALAQHGLAGAVLPLIEIAAAADLAPLREVWRGLARWSLVMFVSANAVQRFFAAAPAGCSWPTGLRAAVTGPGSAAALQSAGVDATQVIAPPSQFDSEGLWQRLVGQPWGGQAVLVVRGDEGRDWLAERWREAGASVQFVNAYRRVLPRWSVAESAHAEQALAAPEHTTWLFSSSEAVANLRTLLPQAEWAHSRALATHARVAEAAQRIGFERLRLVAPLVSAVAAAMLEAPGSLQSRPL